MLIIVFDKTVADFGGEKVVEGSVSWHVGKPAPIISNKDVVRIVQADGDELEYVKHVFSNITMRSDKPVVMWAGETAEFIARNL